MTSTVASSKASDKLSGFVSLANCWNCTESLTFRLKLDFLNNEALVILM